MIYFWGPVYSGVQNAYFAYQIYTKQYKKSMQGIVF